MRIKTKKWLKTRIKYRLGGRGWLSELYPIGLFFLNYGFGSHPKIYALKPARTKTFIS